MEKLIKRLEDFKYYQLAKFIKARSKHSTLTDTNDALNDNTNWKNWDINDMETHLEDELKEYLNAVRFESIEAQKLELTDIANIAFLLWAKLEYDN